MESKKTKISEKWNMEQWLTEKRTKNRKTGRCLFNEKGIYWRLEVAGDAKDARLPEIEVATCQLRSLMADEFKQTS